MNELCNRISDILRYEAREITYQYKDGKLVADLDCYAICGSSVCAIDALAREIGRTFIVTIQTPDNPKIQIVL